MGLTFEILRQKAARYLVGVLWLHLPLIWGLAFVTHTDLVAPLALGLVLAGLASFVALRRSLAPLGSVLVALAFGGMVSVVVGLLQSTPWLGIGSIYIATAMALTLALCSGPAVLAFAGLALLPDLAVHGLTFAYLGSWPFLAVQAVTLAGLAQALAHVLQTAQAQATAARAEAESLWHARTDAQIIQSQFIAALVERITALARNPVSPAPTQTTFPFAYAEVEWAIDLLAQKLQRGGGLTDLSGFAAFTQIDLAAATTQLASCLQDQSARLSAISNAARGDYRAKILHQMRLDLADLSDQTHQTAAFAAELSQAAEGYIKTPFFGRPYLDDVGYDTGFPFAKHSVTAVALTHQVRAA